MKKQNRNVCAYVRQPHVQHNEELLMALKSNRQSGNQTMFNQIVGQMDQQLTSYLNKLVTKNEKQQQKKKQIQKPSNHQRTKSYADILVQTPSSSKTPAEKGHSHRGSHPSTQINNLFFSLNNTPTNQKANQNKNQSKIEKNIPNNSFLETLDSYISDLSFNKSISIKKSQVNIEQSTIQRKNNQKAKQNSSSQLKFLQKLQASSKRQKQLKIANRILQSQNSKLKNKLKKNKILVKTTMQQLYQYAQTLSQELKQQKRQRRKLQQFISQFQQKFTMLRPERKTLGARHRLEDFLLVSQTTQQDDVQLAHQCPSIRSKSLKRRKPLPRSTAKHSRVSGIIMQDFSAMLASKNFQFDEDDQQTDPYEA